MHTLASLLPQEENTPGMLPSPTCERCLKHTASQQSCPDVLPAHGRGAKPLLPGERIGSIVQGWLPGVCSTWGCMAVDMYSGSHQDHANTLAQRKIIPNRNATETRKKLVLLLKKISAMTSYTFLLFRGENGAGPCLGLRCHPRLSCRC